jgi:aldose 1-epimerase
MRYRVSTATRGAGAVYQLHDDESGASASVLPISGFNLFDLRLPLGGEVRPVIEAEEGFADHPPGGAGQGTPILFPFPNRIRGGSFEFQGRRYTLPANQGPNAIHGFAFEASWEVVGHESDEGGASVTGRYQISRQTPERLGQWPTDGVVQVRYTLGAGRLTMTTTISNPTASDLPYGFGIHPYFRLPFQKGGDLERTRVILPATKAWVLEEFLPTGEVQPVPKRLDFRSGQPMQGLRLDDVLTGLVYEDGWAFGRLIDLDRNAEFRLVFDRSFRELVVYTPPDRPGVISLEPYTQTTDAINLQGRGVDAGLRVLRHGERDELVIRMETASFQGF